MQSVQRNDMTPPHLTRRCCSGLHRAIGLASLSSEAAVQMMQIKLYYAPISFSQWHPACVSDLTRMKNYEC
jgi:hypothetical protein